MSKHKDGKQNDEETENGGPEDMETKDVDDPCGSFGPVQRNAYIWFFSIMLLGSLLTYFLAGIDRRMFDTNGEHLDLAAYRQNRAAHSGIASEVVDVRQRATLTTAQKRLAESANN